MARDIFDLSDTSDLPEALRPKHNNVTHSSNVWGDLIRQAGRPVTATEIRAARYRLDGKVISAANGSLNRRLRHIIKRGEVIKLGRGLYVHRDHYKSEAAE